MLCLLLSFDPVRRINIYFIKLSWQLKMILEGMSGNPRQTARRAGPPTRWLLTAAITLLQQQHLLWDWSSANLQAVKVDSRSAVFCVPVRWIYSRNLIFINYCRHSFASYIINRKNYVSRLCQCIIDACYGIERIWIVLRQSELHRERLILIGNWYYCRYRESVPACLSITLGNLSPVEYARSYREKRKPVKALNSLEITWL